jgi:hypothetical protein
MALQANNTTCDIYRAGSEPPAAPSLSAVPLFLTPDWPGGHAANVSSSTTGRWTHVALLPVATDIRDGYNPASSFADGFSSAFDTLYVPDRSGQPYNVVLVTREGRGTAGDVKKVYLQRQQAAWPQDNV